MGGGGDRGRVCHSIWGLVEAQSEGVDTVKPIIFSGNMVRAILEGRKSVTRRVVKPQPNGVTKDGVAYKFKEIEVCRDGKLMAITHDDDGKPFVDTITPPFHRGDILYVRETWCNEWRDPEGWTGSYLYKADGKEVAHVDYGISHSPWRPSIHMPREAARLFLRVTGVRVERLQEITEKDAFAEGVRLPPVEQTVDGGGGQMIDIDGWHKDAFRELWNGLNAKRGYGWDANPFCWVISFEVCGKENEHA